MQRGWARPYCAAAQQETPFLPWVHSGTFCLLLAVSTEWLTCGGLLDRLECRLIGVFGGHFSGRKYDNRRYLATKHYHQNYPEHSSDRRRCDRKRTSLARPGRDPADPLAAADGSRSGQGHGQWEMTEGRGRAGLRPDSSRIRSTR